MKYFSIFSASAILAMLATGAYAADAVVAEPPAPAPAYVAPAFHWSGGYVGAQLDYSWARAGYSMETGFSGKSRSNGFLGGLYTGYNFDMGNDVILGIEGDISMGFKKTRDNDLVGFRGIVSSSTRWNGAFRGRAGFAVDRFLPYVAGGVAFGDVKDSITTMMTSFSSSQVKTGWTVGAGVDYAATDNVILRLEYRYTDFGKQSFDFGGPVNLERKLSSNDLRIGAAYKF